jgi:hypothetical protein
MTISSPKQEQSEHAGAGWTEGKVLFGKESSSPERRKDGLRQPQPQLAHCVLTLTHLELSAETLGSSP